MGASQAGLPGAQGGVITGLLGTEGVILTGCVAYGVTAATLKRPELGLALVTGVTTVIAWALLGTVDHFQPAVVLTCGVAGALTGYLMGTTIARKMKDPACALQRLEEHYQEELRRRPARAELRGERLAETSSHVTVGGVNLPKRPSVPPADPGTARPDLGTS